MALRARRSAARRRASFVRLVEHAEGELGVAEREAVAVDEARAALLLAVDEDLALLVDLFEVEVAPVEEDLRVRLGERRRSARATSLPSARPTVVTGLYRTKVRGGPWGGNHLRMGIAATGPKLEATSTPLRQYSKTARRGSPGVPGMTECGNSDEPSFLESTCD